MNVHCSQGSPWLGSGTPSPKPKNKEVLGYVTSILRVIKYKLGKYENTHCIPTRGKIGVLGPPCARAAIFNW